MSPVRSILFAIPIATVGVAPAVTIAADLVRWPLLLSNSWTFTQYGQLFGTAAHAGLIAGVASGLARYRPKPSAWLAGSAALLLQGLPLIEALYQGTLPPSPLWQSAGDVIANALSTAFVAYWTARWAAAAVRATEPSSLARLRPHPAAPPGSSSVIPGPEASAGE